MRKGLFFFLLVIFLRVILFSSASFHIDMGDWEAWSYRLITLGFSNFYSQNYFSDYFPGYLYILWMAGNVYRFIFPNVSFASFNFEILIKLITTFFDIATAFYIYKITNRYSPKLSKIAAFLYLINPAIIFNSSVWGQIDGIFTFFLVYSSHLLTESKKPVLSSFYSGMSILIKPHSIAMSPVYFLYILKNFKKKLVVSIAMIVLTPILLSVPFFINDPVFGLFKIAQNSVNVYPFTSLYAFNFWGIFGWWQPDNKILLFSLKDWGIILYAVSLIVICLPLLRRKIEPLKFYLGTSLSFLSVYLFLTRMHERYLFPFFAFLLIAGVIKKSKILLSIYLIISLIHLINLWYVYYYYNFIYNSPAQNPSASINLFNLIDKNHGIFSIIIIVGFFVLLNFYHGNKKIFK